MTSEHTLADLSERSFAAVLFDLDGTLVSSTRAVVRSWARLAEEYAIPSERFFHVHGIPARAALARMLADRTPREREEAYDRILEIELADTADTDVLPGAAGALDVLVTDGRCAIVTSGGRRLAQARIVAAGLPIPRVLITVDDVERGKPEPDPYLAGAQALGVAPGDCLAVEDAPPGIASAQAAGCAVLALATTYPAGDLGAHVVVPDLASVRFAVGPDGIRVRHAPGTESGSNP